MKAIQFREYGKPDVLQVVDKESPELKPGFVLVKVKAAGVNFADVMHRYGTYLTKTPLPYTPGAEVAGVVVETTSGVENFKEGDSVVALTDQGCYAEYVSLHESQLVKIPENVDYEEAAAILLQGLTAYHTLKTSGQLAKGETVLVHAAAGGVGTIAVQLAKLMGAGKVIATASSKEKLKLASTLGADVCLNYMEEDWDEKLMEHTGGKGVDVILEMVGGEIFTKSLQCLNTFGRLVIYGRAGMQDSPIDPLILMKKNTSIIGFWLPRIIQRPELYKEGINDLLTYIGTGELKLIIGETFRLEEAALAHQQLEGRNTTGKLVLIP